MTEKSLETNIMPVPVKKPQNLFKTALLLALSLNGVVLLASVIPSVLPHKSYYTSQWVFPTLYSVVRSLYQGLILDFLLFQWIYNVLLLLVGVGIGLSQRSWGFLGGILLIAWALFMTGLALLAIAPTMYHLIALLK